MANVKKISYKNIASRLPEREICVVTLDGDVFDGMTVQVKTTLTMPEISALISDIVSTLVDVETGEYSPEFSQLVSYMFYLKHYAGIPIGKNDLASAYRVIYETDILAQVLSKVDNSQMAMIDEAVRERLSFMREMLVATAGNKVVAMLSEMEQLTGAMSAMTDSIDIEKLQGLMAAIQMPELTSAIEMGA